MNADNNLKYRVAFAAWFFVIAGILLFLLWVNFSGFGYSIHNLLSKDFPFRGRLYYFVFFSIFWFISGIGVLLNKKWAWGIGLALVIPYILFCFPIFLMWLTGFLLSIPNTDFNLLIVAGGYGVLQFLNLFIAVVYVQYFFKAAWRDSL